MKPLSAGRLPMITTVCRTLVILVALALSGAPFMAHASPQDIAFHELTLDTKKNPITVNLGFGLTNYPLLADMLRNGARVELYCTVTLLRKRLLWTDVTLAEKNLAYRLRYDPLTREFLMESGDRPPIGHKNLEPLLKKALGGIRVPLGTTAMLEPENSYVVRVVTGLRHLPSSLNLSKSVFFKNETIIPDTSIAMSFEY